MGLIFLLCPSQISVISQIPVHVHVADLNLSNISDDILSRLILRKIVAKQVPDH